MGDFLPGYVFTMGSSMAHIYLIKKSSSLKKTHPEDYSFFWNLFQNHPNKMEKRTEDIIDIKLNKAQWSDGGPFFSLIYNDGSEATISWGTCLI